MNKTFKQSSDPLFEEEKNRVLELYAIADGKTERTPPALVITAERNPLRDAGEANAQLLTAAGV